MNKNELIAQIADVSGRPRGDVVAVLNAFTDTIQDQVQAGEEVTLPGIGKVKVVQREERQARNPATGEAVTIPAKKALKFTFAKNLKDAANSLTGGA